MSTLLFIVDSIVHDGTKNGECLITENKLLGRYYQLKLIMYLIQKYRTFLWLNIIPFPHPENKRKKKKEN